MIIDDSPLENDDFQWFSLFADCQLGGHRRKRVPFSIPTIPVGPATLLERGEEFHVVRFEGTDLQKRMMAGMTGMEVLFMVNRYGKIIRPNGDFAVAMITYDYWMVYRISMGFIWLNTSEYSFTHLKIAEACGLWGFPESWPQTFHDAMVIKFHPAFGMGPHLDS